MELLEFAREQGIYRPGRRGPKSEDVLVGEQREAPQAEAAAAGGRRREDHRPVQLSLF
jgi:hypothetical protein